MYVQRRRGTRAYSTESNSNVETKHFEVNGELDVHDTLYKAMATNQRIDGRGVWNHEDVSAA